MYNSLLAMILIIGVKIARTISQELLRRKHAKAQQAILAQRRQYWLKVFECLIVICCDLEACNVIVSRVIYPSLVSIIQNNQFVYLSRSLTLES